MLPERPERLGGSRPQHVLAPYKQGGHARDHPIGGMRGPGRVPTLRFMDTGDVSAGGANGLWTWRDGPTKRAIVELVERVTG